MTPGSANLLLAAADAGGYQISRSLRFRSSAGAYLNRTMGTGSTQKYTYSAWVKRGILSTGSAILSTNRSFVTSIEFLSGNTLLVYTGDGSSLGSFNWTTSQVFRDPSAWYHIVVAWDTTQATATNRLKVYVNGTQITSFGTQQTITQNMALGINGSNMLIPTSAFDGYITEINFVDGQQLTPSSFGQTNPITGVWQPIKYAGTYGTNGFYLNFSDNSAATAAAIGKDSSGNGNNWTPNNISVTSGVTYDSMIDTPTAYDDTTVYGRGNYPTLNPLQQSPTAFLSNGNLRLDPTGTGVGAIAKSTFGGSGGIKFYVEFNINSIGSGSSIVHCAICDSAANPMLATFNGSFTYYRRDGNIDGTTYATYTSGDIIAAAVDTGANTVSWYKNNVLQVTRTGFSYDAYFAMFMVSNAGGSYGYMNFGQRPFAYTPPSGFKALNTQNLPTPTIAKGNAWMDIVTRNGFGTSGGSITSLNFQPDLIWNKTRSAVNDHYLMDSIRGSTKILSSNLTNIEATNTTFLTSFNSNGYTMGTGDHGTGVTVVDWLWKKGATPGFDIVTYTAPSSPAAASYSHSLGVKPDMMIVKARNLASRNWAVYHKSLGATQCLRLNLTSAVASVSTYWNNTEPTSTVFTVGTDNDTNANTYNYVAYLFAEVAGFSKFGSYAGNGSTDGPFVYCGFRPRFILSKNINQSTGTLWHLHDTARNTYNYVSLNLSAHASNAEYNYGTTISYDITANGFKVRGDDYSQNGSGNTHIFAAFAENPFKYALAR